MRAYRAHILYHLANVYSRYLQRYQEAIQLYDEAIAISGNYDDQNNIGHVLTYKGLALDGIGDLEASLRCQKKKYSRRTTR
jgi:tetratricopeptide (TPR) repeat protein